MRGEPIWSAIFHEIFGDLKAPILHLFCGYNEKGKTILHEQLPNLKLQIPEFPQSMHKIEPIIV